MFFCFVAPSIQSEIDFAHKSFNYFLKNPCNESIFIKPCTNKEIRDIISDLGSKKATGPNSILTKIMKLAKEFIANNLFVLFNFPFSQGIFPVKLKIAKILPVFKKGSKLESQNYRSISLLSNLDKIIEKLMHKRLVEFLNQQKILYCKQYGFRKGFSTAHGIIKLIDNIETAIDNKKLPVEFLLTCKKHLIQLITTFYLKKLNTMISEE